jgi:hypothetical protein
MASIYPGRGVTASVWGRHLADVQQRGGDIVTAIDTALVVGGGTAGAAAAILLARCGVAVDLVESSPDVTALGSGIALHGNGLRVLDALGLLDGCVAQGYAFSTVAIRAPDSRATVLAELESFRTGGPALPAALGMYRPDLARILMSAAQAAGVSTRFATTVGATRQDEHGVEIDFSDGSHGRYDVVIGADGVRSRTRRAMGVSLDTVPVGLGVWRIFASRPAEVTRAELYYGGRCSSAGYTPTSRHSLYAYLYEPVQDRWSLSPAEQLTVVRDLRSGPAHEAPWSAASQRGGGRRGSSCCRPPHRRAPGRTGRSAAAHRLPGCRTVSSCRLADEPGHAGRQACYVAALAVELPSAELQRPVDDGPDPFLAPRGEGNPELVDDRRADLSKVTVQRVGGRTP